MFYYNLIICFLSVLFWLYLIYAGWELAHHRPPFVPSPCAPKKIALAKISALLDKATSPQTIVDAGCGNGSLIGSLAKKYPSHHFIGIEYNKSLYNYCSHKYKKVTNLKFLHQDLLTFDYSETDIIYYFGLPTLSEKFEKILCQLSEKTNIIALDATFPNLKLIEKEPFKFWLNQSFVYHYKNSLEK